MANYDSVAVATVGESGNSFDEMAAFFREQLPHPPPDKVLHELFEMEVDLRKKRADLATQRASRDISDKEYLRRINEAVKVWMDRSRKLLGPKDFDVVYGDAGYSSECMIDPAVFPA